MILVDDRWAVEALARNLPDTVGPAPVATTHAFWYRLARALVDPTVRGVLSHEADPEMVLALVLDPPPDRLVVLDPRRTIREAVHAAVDHSANYLLAQLLGAAIATGWPVRVSSQGARWSSAMAGEGIEYAVVPVQN